jgi:8-oxo-dGTP diphosphatase
VAFVNGTSGQSAHLARRRSPLTRSLHRMAWTATNSEGYASPAALAADLAVLTVRDDQLCALAVRRGDGAWALPGVLVTPEETPERAALRALADKTGVADVYLEQLATFAAPARDPRGWIPSVAHLALVAPTTEPGDPDAVWVAARGGRRRFAFDHRAILDAAIDRLEGKLWWSNAAVGMLPGAFSMTDARRVYEAVAGRTYDPASFARDLRATGLIEPTGDRRAEGPGRPAALYRFIERTPTWGAGRRKRV